MKKILLLLTMLIGTAISLLAAEASYSITFKKGDTDNTTAANTGNFNTSDNIESGMEYIKSVTECTKIYPHNKQGLKFGSSKGGGTLTFGVADDVASYKVTRIVLTCIKYGSDTGELNVKYGDISGQGKTPPASEDELEWKLEQPTAISSISISTTTKRAYVSKITVYYEKEVQPLGEITASINGKPLTIDNGEVIVTVPAMNGAEQSSLTVTCPNAETIALTGGETQNGETYTLPIAFTNGEAEYNFSISNSISNESKSLYIYAAELGVPVLKDGETTLNGNSIEVEANKSYTVSAVNAESITVKKDETDVPLTNNTLTFTEGGTYVFTATAGDFSTSATYDVTIANTNTPATPVVTLNGTALTAGETSALLNSTISISCTDATSIKVGGVNGETVIPSNHGEYKITKPGEYTIYGINKNAPAGSQESPEFIVTFTLTLGTPEIHVGGSKVEGSEITLPAGGSEIELVAVDAEGHNAVASFEYKVGEGEPQTVTGNKLTVTEAGTYTFTAHSADNAVSTASFTATITIAKAEVYVRATDVSDLYEGAKVIIVCEDNGYAAGTTGSALDVVNAGIDKSGKWTYDDTKGVGRFVLKGTGVTNQYAFQMGEGYFYAEDRNGGTGIMSAGTTLENKFKFNVSFDENGVNLNPLSNTNRRVYVYNTQDVRTYTSKQNTAHYVQLYVIQPTPKTPALAVNGEAVTDFSEITVKVGDKAVFTSKDATKMKVNGVEQAENPYTVTFAESDFTDGVATYTVSGVNETGESETLTVTFKLDLTPAAPVAKIGEQVVEGNAVEVQPGDVMTVTAAEGTTLVYTKADGAETTCDGNSFSYTFTTADYSLGADGMVSATPVAYTFKAKKGDLVSDVATLNVTVKEPAIPNVYRLVTSDADLQDGKKYLLVAMGENKVASNNYTSTQINVVADAVTPENNRINATDEMMVFELEWQAETNDWRIKSGNISGKEGYHYMYVGASAGVNFNTSDGEVDNFTISVDRNSGTADIKRNVEGVQRMILYHTTTNCFKNYAVSNKDNKDYSQVQLYVQEEKGLNAATFAEFTEQNELHPGREVKFVEPLAIKAHYGNEMWMEDKNGTPVYATYNKDTFADYLMNELNANRTFWNFSGKAKAEAKVTENAPIYVEITGIDVAYTMDENNGDIRTGKVPYFVDLTEEMAVPLFGEDPAWWSFGQIKGTIATTNGKTTITTESGAVYTVLTNLPPLPPKDAPTSVSRYENQNSFDWVAGGDNYFAENESYKDKYLVGAIVADDAGNKAIAAMAVSGTQVTTGVETVDADDPEALVDVYNMQGMRLRSGVRRAEAVQNLPAGIYIAGGKKVLVKQ